ncbi:ABC transporter substrate-binding protein [Sphingobacterium bovistauri]|uniref:ABC transporter substrate-binding protein n=1 Tax=Sphingobacterium bovistauri TaxID=2781959 RepID=A0ABS7Z5H0_9SPHI|nr:ABC transporter substrate-binding protein [Sphingobacterium bovistauri]MCA5005436.1 ABC transporter substrate-binding protein [Sphingobacterium bovistauri]
MTKFQEIISNLQHINPSKAELLEEEIDIIQHKLKFLSKENLPKTLVLDQKSNFHSLESVVLAEKINTAGGVYIESLDGNPDCIIILQENENLYSQLSNVLDQEKIKATNAYMSNNIYIIQFAAFNTLDEEYLKDTEILAEILQPKYFVYGHDGISWVKFEI